MDTIKIAVIGAGYWGKNLVRNFHQLGVLEAICDANASIRKQMTSNYPDVRIFENVSDVINDETISAVVIAAPAVAHYELAYKALEAGKHVFVEKPLALHEDEGKELIALAKDRALILMVGHLLQYHPVFIRLKKLVYDGELGKINYILSNRLNFGKIRSEENILWSFAPHDISMILALAGAEPTFVHATGGNYLHQGIADVTTTHLEFSSGLKAHIFVSWLYPFKEQKLVVVGEKKMAVFDDTLRWEDKLILYQHWIDWKNLEPVPMKGEAERVDVPEDEPLKLECRHFLECIANDKTPITDGHEAIRVLNVLNKAQMSLDKQLATRSVESENHLTGDLQLPAKPHIESPATTGKASLYPGTLIHESAIVDENCEIGAGTKIWHFSHILSGSKIGVNCNIGQNVVIGPDVTIGNKCKIQNNVSVYKGVTLEDGVFCGPSMVFTNIYNPRAEIAKMDQVRPTIVKKGVTIGANCTIVCGNTIGSYAFIGAGAVITKDVPDHALMVGNPARQIGSVCKCGEKLDENDLCPLCGKVIR